jgi:predicted nuclease of restriction endonuclease-like (RecB) superfamily
MNKLSNFYSDVKNILGRARQKAYSTVNTIMVETYWLIGRRIVEEEQKGSTKAEYGEYLITELSKALTSELGKGFSYANLWNFRQFYLTFPKQEILYTLCRELSWSALRLIMRINNQKARNYYLEETRTQQWSARQLQRNINTHYYERLLSSKNKYKELTKQSEFKKLAVQDFIKDPYILEFLNIPQVTQPKEKEIENAIINNLSKFLLEAGKGFSFIGRQFRISTETSHFYIDLVFYNHLLKCFVLIDIKSSTLAHQDIGQMDTYVRMFDDLKRGSGDNPTIGLILCSSKDETIVKYSSLKNNDQIFASKYRLVLPTEEELIAELEREKQLFLECT